MHDYCWFIPDNLPRPARAAAVVVVVTLSLLAAACSVAEDGAEPAGSAPTSVPESSTGPEDGVDPDLEDDADTDGDDTDDENGNEGGSEGDRGDGTGPTGDDDVATLLSELGGQLAIGNGPVVAVARPDGQRYIELDGGRTNLASQPTWSADGTALAWSSVSPLAQEARVQFFDSEGVAVGDAVSTNVPGPPIFYFQWRPDGGEVAYLRNSTRRRTVEAGVLTPGGSARWLAEGDPFFVAWAPTEPIIGAHVAEERVVLFDPAEAVEFGVDREVDPNAPVAPEPDEPAAGAEVVDGGGFSSPAWLDDETLVAVVDGALSTVDIETGRAERLIEVDGPIRFVLSPDRSRIAFQSVSDGDDENGVLEVGWTPMQERSADTSLAVIDVADGSVEIVTDRLVAAWEWSPDSTKLAWLDLDGAVSHRRARWRFWSAEGPVPGDNRSPTVVLSIKELVNYLPFFAQFSFSLQRWSPDSSAFAVVGAIRGRDGVWIQLVDEPADPVLVAPGDVVSWGFGPTPSPDAGRSPL